MIGYPDHELSDFFQLRIDKARSITLTNILSQNQSVEDANLIYLILTNWATEVRDKS